MAWWDKVKSAAKSAVNKVKTSVRKVATTIKKSVKKAVKRVSSSVRKVKNTAKKSARKTVRKVKSSVRKIKNTVKKTARKAVDKADDNVQAIKSAVVKKLREAEKEVKKKIEAVKESVKKTAEKAIEEVRRATWPKMPADLPLKLRPYWRRMEEAYIKKEKKDMVQVLRELIPMTASPIPALNVILGIAGIVGLIVTLIGTYTFAGFIREEALQTISFAIKTAKEREDIEGMEKAIAFQKELLERTLKEKIIGAIPILTLQKELGDFYKASEIKLGIDERSLEILKMSLTGEGLPEIVKATVRDIIDGDTIDVSLDAINQTTGEDIKLPQYAKTGHARVRIVGINAPEKSPKGEIACSDVEIFEVEKEFADKSRDRLRPLNDKEVILKIDPEIPVGTHGRILAVVEYGGVDIGLRQIKEGLACGYYREPHKYFDEDEYSEETLEARDEGVGMWKGLEEVEKEEDKIKIKITSTPTNARLFLDDVALHHNTPSDERELSDVLHLFELGDHVLSAEKAGLSAMEDIEIVKGDNGAIHLTLEAEPILEVPTPEEVEEEELEEELIEEEIIEPAVGPVKPAEIPKEYTDEQAWALKEAFAEIYDLTVGRAMISKEERGILFNKFTLYSDGQKAVLDLLWKDLIFYTQGRKQLSGDEFILLKEKYRMLEG